MKHQRLVFMGFGNVGQAFLRLLEHKKELLEKEYELTLRITGIATGHHGMVIDHQGIDPARVLELAAARESISSLSSSPQPSNPYEFIRASDADVLFENTPVSYVDGEPALSYLRTALQLGMHAITANKGPVVHGYQELTELAKQLGTNFFFESAVMDGAPIFSLFRECLPGMSLRAFRGILNSTTNLILTRMETGDSFDGAVAYAQSIGLAETDPSGDIDGWDASVKVAALVTVLMGVPLKPTNVDRTGIRGITAEDIRTAGDKNQRWKLVCSAQNNNGTIKAQVKPELVGTDSPLYGVSGTSSIVTFESDVLPQLSIVEGNPGPETTAYGLLADFINAIR
jgi:homoserine dehydrogenase